MKPTDYYDTPPPAGTGRRFAPDRPHVETIDREEAMRRLLAALAAQGRTVRQEGSTIIIAPMGVSQIVDLPDLGRLVIHDEPLASIFDVAKDFPPSRTDRAARRARR